VEQRYNVQRQPVYQQRGDALAQVGGSVGGSVPLTCRLGWLPLLLQLPFASPLRWAFLASIDPSINPAPCHIEWLCPF